MGEEGRVYIVSNCDMDLTHLCKANMYYGSTKYSTDTSQILAHLPDVCCGHW